MAEPRERRAGLRHQSPHDLARRCDVADEIDSLAGPDRGGLEVGLLDRRHVPGLLPVHSVAEALLVLEPPLGELVRSTRPVNSAGQGSRRTMSNTRVRRVASPLPRTMRSRPAGAASDSSAA